MSPSNPYRAPESQVGNSKGSPVTRILLLVLVAVQVLVFLLVIPESISLVRAGEVSPLVFLAAMLVAVLFFLGGLAMLFHRRWANSLFLVSALLGLAVMLDWRPAWLMIGVGIGIVALVVGRRLHSNRG